MSRYKDRKKVRKNPRKWAKAKPEMEKKLDAEHFNELTALNQQQSPLLRLPRELRDEIVNLALLGVGQTNCFFAWALRLTLPAVLLVCRQLRTESASMYFSNTVIRRAEAENDKGYFSGFNHTYKKHIKRMRLSYEFCYRGLDETAAIARAAKLDAATCLPPGTWVVYSYGYSYDGDYNGLGERVADLEAVFRG